MTATLSVPPYAVAVRVSRRGRGAVPVLGAGLVVGPRHVVTCLHVILMAEGTEVTRARLDDQLPSAFPFVIQSVPELTVAAGVGNGGEIRTSATLVDEDTTNDLALLQLPAPLHGVVPPAVAAPGVEGRLFSIGCQLDRLATCDHGVNGPGSTVTVDGRAILHRHAYGAPPGFSGGPVIVRDTAGGDHRLVGLTVFGGLVAAGGAFVPAAAVQAFLAPRGHALPERASGGPQPGIAAEVTIPVSGRGERMFRAAVVDGRALFRAVAPMTVDEPPSPRSLPLHVASADAAAELRGRFLRHRSGDLRLPTAVELDTFAAQAARSTAPSVGLPLRVADWGAGVTGLATPLGGAEWATDSIGRITLYRRDRRTRTIEAVDPAAAQEADGSLRYTIQPVFQPGPLHDAG